MAARWKLHVDIYQRQIAEIQNFEVGGESNPETAGQQFFSLKWRPDSELSGKSEFMFLASVKFKWQPVKVYM